MGVERIFVAGYGFTVTEEEVEAYIERSGRNLEERFNYETLYEDIQLKNPGITVHMVGNQWNGPTGYLIALSSRSGYTSDDRMEGTNELNTFELASFDPGMVANLLEAKSLVIPEDGDRFVGWQTGIYVA